MVRKRAIIEGTFGDFNPIIGICRQTSFFSFLIGGWKPEWDEPRKIVSLRPYKGHLRDKTRQQRFVSRSHPLPSLAELTRLQKQCKEWKQEKLSIVRYFLDFSSVNNLLKDIEQKKPVKNFRSTFKRIERMAKEKMEREISRSSDDGVA